MSAAGLLPRDAGLRLRCRTTAARSLRGPAAAWARGGVRLRLGRAGGWARGGVRLRRRAAAGCSRLGALRGGVRRRSGILKRVQ